MQDVRAYKGTDVASKHKIVIAKTLLRLSKTGGSAHAYKRHDTNKLNIPETRTNFVVELRNRFSCLSDRG